MRIVLPMKERNSKSAEASHNGPGDNIGWIMHAGAVTKIADHRGRGKHADPYRPAKPRIRIIIRKHGAEKNRRIERGRGMSRIKGTDRTLLCFPGVGNIRVVDKGALPPGRVFHNACQPLLDENRFRVHDGDDQKVAAHLSIKHEERGRDHERCAQPVTPARAFRRPVAGCGAVERVDLGAVLPGDILLGERVHKRIGIIRTREKRPSDRGDGEVGAGREFVGRISDNGNGGEREYRYQADEDGRGFIYEAAFGGISRRVFSRRNR